MTNDDILDKLTTLASGLEWIKSHIQVGDDIRKIERDVELMDTALDDLIQHFSQPKAENDAL